MTQPLDIKELEKQKSLPVAWNGSMCDDCGIIAVYTASKNGFDLNFCGHHLRKHAAKLVQDGFTIVPETYNF